MANLSTGSAGAEECRALCCKNTACNSFTFAWHKASPAQTQCYLKADGLLQPSSNCDAAGAYECMSGAYCKVIVRKPGNDAPGGDLSQISGASEAACNTACCGSSQCVGYTYVPT